uniref:CRIC domain-containing protein n=1 Tax=Sciurus vulgaris TaxID=55149 RepID=A0A8D2AIE0_SCIVU
MTPLFPLPLTLALPPGLDDSLQDYPFEDWALPGKYLLQLCPRSLEALTVWPLGHQELILDGVEQLQALNSGLQTENLQTLTEGLLEGTQALTSLVKGRLGDCAETPADVLSAAVELVREARVLLFWLNRYLFSHLNDFSACQEIGVLCGELSQVLQEVGQQGPVQPSDWDLPQYPELQPRGAAGAEGCAGAGAAGRAFGDFVWALKCALGSPAPQTASWRPFMQRCENGGPDLRCHVAWSWAACSCVL